MAQRSAHRILIPFAGGAGAGGYHGELEPGVVLQQGNEALAHHAGGAHDAYLILFHKKVLLLFSAILWSAGEIVSTFVL